MRVLLLLLLSVALANAGTSTFSNNIDMRTGFNVAPEPAPPSPSLIAQTLNVSSPVHLGDNVGSIGGTNTPTMWAMTGCAGCAGYFNTDQTSGQITIAQGGVTALNGTVDLVNLFPVTVTASNAGGTAQVDETVKVYALPVITAKTVGVAFPLPPTTTVLTTAATTRGGTTITGWNITNCTPACANWFVINGAGQIQDTSIGQSNAHASTNYTLTVAATNPGGTGSNQIILAVGQALGPPVVTAQIKNISTPSSSGETILTVGATNVPTSFNVTNCTPGCAGFFTFPDITKPQLAVSTTGAANLTGTVNKNGPFQVTVLVGNSGGGQGQGMMTVTAYADGSKQVGTSGAAQHPTFFDSYVTRPPWKVAGVDYPVGIQTGVVLKNPSTMTAAQCGTGCSINAGTHTITVGSNVTLTGWDFSLGGGWSLNLSATLNNVIISNSNFAMPTNGLPLTQNAFNGTGGSNLTFINCVFDATNAPAPRFTNPGIINWLGNNLTVKNSWIKNGGSDGISSGVGTINLKYNFMENINIPGQADAHPDFWQPGAGNATIIATFNVASEQIPGGPPIGPQGFVLANNPTTWVGQSEVGYNAMVCAGATNNNPQNIQCAYMTGQQSTFGAGGTALTDNNYVDMTKSFGFFYRDNNISASPPGFTITNNINMVDGSICTPTSVCGGGGQVIQPPVVTAAILVGSSPTQAGQAVNSSPRGPFNSVNIQATHMTSTDTWTVTNCVPTCTNFFKIATQANGSGQLQVDTAGAAAITGTVPQNGPYTVTVQATNGGGSGTNAANVTIYADGSTLVGTTGVTQLPTLLSGYGANRPPWKVAGVDYPVGIQAGIALKDPATSPLPTGCTYNPGTEASIFCDTGAAGQTLQGFDLTLHNGVVIGCNANNLIIKNNNIKIAVDRQDPPIYVQGGWTCNNLSVLNNIINQNNKQSLNPTSFPAAIYTNIGGSTNVTVRYNLIENSFSDGWQSPAGNAIAEFNLFLNNGLTGEAVGAHPDLVQGAGTATLNYNFNTAFQFVAQGFGSRDPPNTLTGASSISRNTLVVGDGTASTVFQNAGNGALSGGNTLTFNQNYVDPRNVVNQGSNQPNASFFYTNPPVCTTANTTCTANINMNTGQVCTGGSNVTGCN